MARQRFGPNPRKLVPNGFEARVEAKLLMDKILLNPGLRTIRSPNNTPKKTGQLIGSTRVIAARWIGFTLMGSLVVGVEYARFQEFRHPTKALYALRAINLASRKLQDDISGTDVLKKLGLRVGRQSA